MKTQTSNRLGAFIALAVLTALPTMAIAASPEKVDFPTAVATIQGAVNKVGQPGGPIAPEFDPNVGNSTEAGIAIVGHDAKAPVKQLFDNSANESLEAFLKKTQDKTSATDGGR